MKTKIVIETNEDKEYYYNILDSVNSKTSAYKLLNLSDNSYGKKELERISAEVNFDLNVYAERRKAPKKYCLQCGAELKRGQHKFCSSSCSATFNNLNRDKSVYEKVSNSLKKEKVCYKIEQTKQKYDEVFKLKCLNCGDIFESKNSNAQFCSGKCSSEYKHKMSYNDFIQNNEKYCRPNYTPKSFKKEFLKEQNGVCAICGGPTMHNGKTLVFVLDHIDGDASNNKRENLRMICPNCDSQLDTYKSKNKNSTRRNYWKNKIIRDIQGSIQQN